MIIGSYRKTFLKINALWFYDKNEGVPSNLPRADIVYYHNGDAPPSSFNTVIWPFYTVCVDLTQDLERILSSFTPNCRNEVRRAQREGVHCEWYDSEQLSQTSSPLDRFQAEYSAFVRAKGIRNVFNRRALHAYIADNRVVLTTAQANGEILAQHIYLCDGHRARLLYSVSGFRHNLNNKSLYGKANRLLHYHDIEHFKADGVTLLDFGGISSFENPNGVDHFKLSFGGFPASYSNAIVGTSVFGAGIVALLKVLKR